MTADYSVSVDSTGNAQATLFLKGTGTIDVPLPIDVASPQVRGALYVQSSDGIKASIGSTEEAAITFSSAVLTSKSKGVWTIELELPKADETSVLFSLPSNAVVSVTQPSAAIEQQEEGLIVSWEVKDKRDNVVAQYSLEGPGPVPAKDYTTIYIIVVLVLIAAIVGVVVALKKKR